VSALDDRILRALADGPLSAPELALRVGAPDIDVRQRLGMMFGTRVLRDGGAWRLLTTPPTVTLAYLAASTCAVVASLHAQLAEGA
jgi:hypothetical protein